MRRVVMPLVVAGLAACTYIYGLDDLAGEAGDAGTSDGGIPPGSSDGGEGGGGDAGNDGAPLDASFAIDCNDKVVGYWPMDEGSGTKVGDRCPLKLDGTLTPLAGSAAWGTRGDGGCVELVGNAFVGLGVRSELQLPGPFTVAGFIRVDETPDGFVGLYWSLGGSYGFEIVVSYDARAYAQVGVADAGVEAQLGNLTKGVWTHLAMVFEPNSRVAVFRDGASIGQSIPPNGSANPNPNEIRFGAVYSGSVWKGALDDIVVYSRALSASEIAALAKR